MGQVNRTKKIILTAALTSALALVGIQSTLAAPGEMNGPGAMKGPGAQQPCPMQNQMMGMQGMQLMQGGPQMSEEMMKARDAFLSETTALRKNIAEKQAAKRALMRGATPDPDKAAALAGELFDLREQLRTKAQAAGLPAGMIKGMGRMNGCSQMACNGRPRGMMGGNAMMSGKHHRR